MYVSFICSPYLLFLYIWYFSNVFRCFPFFSVFKTFMVSAILPLSFNSTQPGIILSLFSSLAVCNLYKMWSSITYTTYCLLLTCISREYLICEYHDNSLDTRVMLHVCLLLVLWTWEKSVRVRDWKTSDKEKFDACHLSASEPYWPSERRLSAKLVPNFADRGCRVVSATDPPAVNSVFLAGAATFPFK
jgi:hypothetical protein